MMKLKKDKLWKIIPMIHMVRDVSTIQPTTQALSIDEQRYRLAEGFSSCSTSPVNLVLSKRSCLSSLAHPVRWQILTPSRARWHLNSISVGQNTMLVFELCCDLLGGLEPGPALYSSRFFTSASLLDELPYENVITEPNLTGSAQMLWAGSGQFWPYEAWF